MLKRLGAKMCYDYVSQIREYNYKISYSPSCFCRDSSRRADWQIDAPEKLISSIALLQPVVQE
jgi:hypothetical protein